MLSKRNSQLIIKSEKYEKAGPNQQMVDKTIEFTRITTIGGNTIFISGEIINCYHEIQWTKSKFHLTTSIIV